MTKDRRLALVDKIGALPISDTMKELACEAVKAGDWGGIGNNLFEIFVTEPKSSAIRKDASVLWKAFPKWAKDIVEESK